MNRVVVVGGSIAALTAVQTLRLEGFEGEITVLSDEDLAPYTRVPLSKAVIAGEESVDEIVLGGLDDVDLQLRTPARGLDLGGRTVHTANGPMSYDGLVIATGAHARTLAPAIDGELLLRSYSDAERIRAHLEEARSVVIVGGGFLGMEIASTCVRLGKLVTVIDLAPPLERLLGYAVARHVRAHAEAMGVRFVVASDGAALIGSRRPIGVRLATGESVTSDLVISAAGDDPNIDWLAGSGLALRGGVVVDHWCRAAPGVVAAGDVAAYPGADGLLRRTPTWTNAVEQARAATRALLQGTDATPYVPSNYGWTEQFGLNIKMVGEPGPDGPFTCRDGELRDGSALLSWPQSGPARTVIAVNHATPPARLKRLAAVR